MSDEATTETTNTTGAGGDLPGADPLLPPTESLSPDEFEDFTERLLNAHKYAGSQVLRTVEVARWGRRGDPQNGIDFAGRLSDASTASWQCKRYKTFSAPKTREVIRDDTYGADVHHLVLSCEAPTTVRREIDKHPTWRLLDKRGLQQLLEDLPRHKRRDVLEATFGSTVRRRLMASPGQDLVISLQSYTEGRLDPSTMLNDLGPFSGRQDEKDSLLAALASAETSPRVVLVTGPGGRGKSRLLLEVLRQVEQADPGRPVVLLAPGAGPSSEAINELPGTAAVVVVDDAHQYPDRMQALVDYLLRVPGTQVVLAYRPSGLQPVLDAVSDRLHPHDIHTVTVDRLATSEARRLVEGLAEGLGLPWNYREQLAQEAVDSPHVAVIALSLIRHGEMTHAPAVDPHLRQHVLGRYRDVATGMVSGIDSDHVSALLAVYAALHGVRDEDEAAEAHIRDLTGLTQRQLLHARSALRDHGVLVTRQLGVSVVVPELLGDQALEDQSAIDGRDTGFAADIWRRFGPTEGPLLLGSLAELEWRLQQREGGGPQVLTKVWADLEDHLLLDDPGEVRHYLQSLQRLAFTHPVQLIAALEKVRARFTDTGDSSAAADQDGSAQGPLSAAQQRRRLFTFAAATPADVLQVLPPLYGRCASRDSTLLEPALEALWALRRLPQQLSDTRPEHPQRVVADMLGDLGRLPHDSFPARIVAAVQRWVHSAGTDTREGRSDVSPLPLLSSLVVKQTTVTEQNERRTMQVGNHFVSPEWATPWRESIRALLVEQAASTDTRWAGEAVSLLHQMLMPLRPTLGATITPEQDASWHEDELATVSALADAARATGSGAVRRHIRHEVAWSAEHARSIPARLQALQLVTTLDQRAEDDLAEALMPKGLHGISHRRGLSAPTVQEMTAERAASSARRKRLSEDEVAAEEEAHHQGAYDRLCAARHGAQSRALERLDALGSAGEVVAAVDAAARDVAALAAGRGQVVSTDALYASVAEARPALVPGLLASVVDAGAGPLDSDVHKLVEAWRGQDCAAALAWLQGASDLRVELRRGIARGWVLHPWLESGPEFGALFDTGLGDADATVRELHLLASFRRFPDDPARAALLLLDADAAPSVCQRALQDAVPGRPELWGASLSQAQAEVVLQLVDRAGWQDWTAEHVAAGVAASHPVLLLEHIAGLDGVTGHEMDPDGLPAALEAKASQTAGWLLERCQQLTPSQKQQVADAAFPVTLGEAVATLLATDIGGADAAQLLGVADCLRHVSLWPARRPGLAGAMLRRARELASSTVTDLLEHLSLALEINVFSFTNGVSEELQEAHNVCSTQVDEEEDADLKRLLIDSRDRLAARMVEMRRDYDEG